MGKAALSVRVSTVEQQDRGSIQTQIDFLYGYCKLYGIEVHDLYVDDGVSGTIDFAERPGGKRLLEDAEKGCFDLVLVYKLDRLSRTVPGFYDTVKLLTHLGVSFRSATENFDTESALGRAMFGLLAVFAAFGRDTIVENCAEGKKRVTREGKWPGGPPPFGYKIVDHYLQVNEDALPCGYSEAGIIRLMFECLAERNLSLQQTCDHLTGLGIPCPAYCRPLRKAKRTPKTHWRSSTLGGMVAQPTYKGIHIYNNVERPCPAIISDALWEKTQEVIEKRRSYCGRGGERLFLLKNLIRCGGCGGPYQASSYRHGVKIAGGRYVYLCARKKRHTMLEGRDTPRCVCPPVDGPRLEAAVWHEYISMITQREETLQEIARELSQIHESSAVTLQEIDTLQNNLNAKMDERKRLNTSYRQGRYSDEEYDEQKAEIIAEESAMSQRLLAITERWKETQNREKQLAQAEINLVEHANRVVDQYSLAEQCGILSDAITSLAVYCQPDGSPRVVLNLTARTLFLPVAGSPTLKDSRPCHLPLWSLERELALAS